MAERLSDIEKPLINQPSLEERLKEYPVERSNCAEKDRAVKCDAE